VRKSPTRLASRKGDFGRRWVILKKGRVQQAEAVVEEDHRGIIADCRKEEQEADTGIYVCI